MNKADRQLLRVEYVVPKDIVEMSRRQHPRARSSEIDEMLEDTAEETSTVY